jgi:hypothetical protein
MLALAADENFNNDILRGLLRRKPNLDLVRIQDAGLSGVDDATVFEWAARENRVLITYDVSTITFHAMERVREGKRMPGVFEVSRSVPVKAAIRSSAVVGMQPRGRMGRPDSLPAAAVGVVKIAGEF